MKALIIGALRGIGLALAPHAPGRRGSCRCFGADLDVADSGAGMRRALATSRFWECIDDPSHRRAA